MMESCLGSIYLLGCLQSCIPVIGPKGEVDINSFSKGMLNLFHILNTILPFFIKPLSVTVIHSILVQIVIILLTKYLIKHFYLNNFQGI